MNEGNNLSQVNNKKDTIKVVLIVILTILLIASLSFIAYDKLIKKDEVNSDTNTNGSNNEIVNPIHIDELPSEVNFILPYLESFCENFERCDSMLNLNNNLSNDDRLNSKLLFTSFSFNNMMEYDENQTLKKGNTEYVLSLSADKMEERFKTIFGPNVRYSNRTFLNDDVVNLVYMYDEETNKYWGIGYGGGDSATISYFELYNQTQDNENEISTYWYSYLYGPDSNSCPNCNFVVDSNGKEYKVTTDNVENEISKLKEEGKISTYKITFKKQSDGKYYIYSGEWV